MSTDRSNKYDFTSEVAYDSIHHEGQLVSLNTSGFVQWFVDGQERWSMSSEEWDAFTKAMANIGRYVERPR
jgi:hypothetical protein